MHENLTPENIGLSSPSSQRRCGEGTCGEAARLNLRLGLVHWCTDSCAGCAAPTGLSLPRFAPALNRTHTSSWRASKSSYILGSHPVQQTRFLQTFLRQSLPVYRPKQETPKSSSCAVHLRQFELPALRSCNAFVSAQQGAA